MLWRGHLDDCAQIVHIEGLQIIALFPGYQFQILITHKVLSINNASCFMT